MYENMQQTGAENPDMDAAGADTTSAGAGADDVVDGDFREV